jgi:bifunctional DNA-binding transcriptional regulator/antitoxin component of YhaV-PrlF toxin-antitoxin module
MRISDRGQVTIPKSFRNRFGLNKDVEIEFVPTVEGLLIQKRTRKKHPVDAVLGILNRPSSTDQYLEEVRGR